jgi:hypothetical protein
MGLRLRCCSCRWVGQEQSGNTKLQPHPTTGEGQTVSDAPPAGSLMPASYQKFTSQMDLGKYLTAQYHIRTPNELLELRDVPPMKTTTRETTDEGTAKDRDGELRWMEAMEKANTAAQVVTAIAPAKLTLAEVRAKLDGKTGKRFWKNLDELAETPGSTS